MSRTHKFYSLIGIIIVSILLIGNTVKGADLPESELACFGLHGPWIKQKEEVIQNGMIMVTYGSTQTSEPNLVTLSLPFIEISPDHVIKTEHPLFYIVDFDHDGIPDASLVNRQYDGHCEHTKFYQDARGTDLEDSKQSSL